MQAQALTRQHDERGGLATLSDFLGRVGAELETLAQVVGEMQEGLSPLLIDAATRHPETYRYAQNLDLVWQTLESLSQATGRAAQDQASRGTADLETIVANLPLSDVALRLCGRSGQGADDDLDLF